MRTILALLTAALLASLGVLAPATAVTAHAATGTKVAIIVGATHSTTSTYRSYANQVYAEAVKYSDNVVKVYSPNATASKVKAAVNGASIIVYLGHGNGWPSPYTYDPSYTTKDGFGLNADLNGDGRTTDYENKYYGEPWIENLRPAPNAVVLLFHLCYASGNSEPGRADPSLSTARKRVDNYASAFLRSGARAVVAIGHTHDPYYIRALFTTRQTIDEYWRNAPDANGNATAYASERTSGTTFQLDPVKPGSYYRSIAGKLSLRTQDVTGAPYSDTSVDPASLVVPGNATPAMNGAPLYGSVDDAVAGGMPAATLPADTTLRVDAAEDAYAVADGSRVYRVHTDDGPAGWMTASALTPRDSAAPRVWEIEDGPAALSPDGNGYGDSLDIAVRLSEAADWTLKIRDGDGHVLDRADGTSDTAAITWAPAKGSVPEGTYRWTLQATDDWGNGPLEADGTFRVDLTRPELSVADALGGVPMVTPNGDGSGDSVKFSLTATEPGSVQLTVRDDADRMVDRESVQVGTGATTVAWDGRDEDGRYVPDGEYELIFAARDQAGNRSEASQRAVVAYAALGFVDASRPVFFPQDGDGLGRFTRFSFRLLSPATVDWEIVDQDGTVLRSLAEGEVLDAGTHAFSWDGRDATGAMAPRGTYRSVVTASDGTHVATMVTSVVAAAFRITASDSTPRRGQKVRITALSGEALSALPKLRIKQPGIHAWKVRMSRVSGKTYQVVIRLRSSDKGTLKLKVVGVDKGGRSQSSVLRLPLH